MTSAPLTARYRSLLAFAALATFIACHAFAADAPDGSRWWSHVVFLADDALEGRDTGSAGHRKAAEYVAREFEKMGVRPAGTQGYLQPVEFKSRTIDEAHSGVALVRGGAEQALRLGEDCIISLRVDPAPTLEAPLVFAGYGLSIPEVGHDDFKDLDARGKLVVYLRGAPPSIPGPLAAHAQSEVVRSAALRKAGAIGSVTILNPKSMDIPWERASLARFLPSMTLADRALDESHGMKAGFAVNPAHADTLLAGTGHDMKALLEADGAGKPLPHFEIPAKLKATISVKRADVTSENVVGLLPGADAALKKEYVVFSAHLDHLGIGKPIKGDSIYNGAMDNASGIAALLDVAAILKESGAKLRRSVIFVAVTGEEKGLLGSKYFAHKPTVEKDAIVANLNTDMFLPLYPLKRLTVYGVDESDLGAEAVAVAKAMGLGCEPDPEPKRNVFIRSDQYSFIRRGIPALMFKVAFAQGTAEEETFRAWLKERYHAPSDDIKQPVDKAAAGAFDQFMAKLLQRVANREERPRWNESSFFKRYANERQESAGGGTGGPAEK
jgi:Zn-dependent M28 family amino/carboxypeptidase